MLENLFPSTFPDDDGAAPPRPHASHPFFASRRLVYALRPTLRRRTLDNRLFLPFSTCSWRRRAIFRATYETRIRIVRATLCHSLWLNINRSMKSMLIYCSVVSSSLTLDARILQKRGLVPEITETFRGVTSRQQIL